MPFVYQSFAVLDAKMALMVHADTLRPKGKQACHTQGAPLPMTCFSGDGFQDICCPGLHHISNLECQIHLESAVDCLCMSRLHETFHNIHCCADAFTFLEPFSWELWVCLVLFVFGVGLVLTLLARLSPMGLFDLRKVAVHVKGTSGDVTRQYAIHDGKPGPPQHHLITDLSGGPLMKSGLLKSFQMIHGST